MIRRNDFSLRAVSVSSVCWWLTVLTGGSLSAFALYRVVTTSYGSEAPALITVAILLIALELLPFVRRQRHDPHGVVMSTAFVVGALIVWGPWPAIAMVTVASAATELRAHSNLWRVMFYSAQYAVTTSVSAMLALLAGGWGSIAHPRTYLDYRDLPWIAGVCVIYFCLHHLLMGIVRSYRQPLSQVVVDGRDGAMSLAVLALSPLVAVLAQQHWRLLPLLVVPLFLLYHTAQMEMTHAYDAAHDSLTGLPNRTSLQAALNAALVRYQRDRTPFGLLLVDMDDFKRVNDTLGHQAGDELLVRFAARLRESVRPADVVARLGGDEFAIVVQAAQHDEAREVAERIRDRTHEPIRIGSAVVDVAASVGIARCPDHSTDADTLLRFADVAMYAAKESGSAIETYCRERDPNSADRLSLLGQLRRALTDGTIELYYQPKVAARDASPIGFEALVRWQHLQRGFIPPDEFVPLAEQSGIMPLLTERVVTLAVEQMSQWRAEGLHAPVAVNISPTDLGDVRLISLITRLLREHGLPASMLELEITERTVAVQNAQSDHALARLREMGVAISLDDFGTGYSSLQRLQSVPVDELKIDRVFVSSLTGRGGCAGIVRAMVEMAHALGLTAIAEGVETAEQWQALRTLGCDGVQGWRVAHPMTPDAAGAWLRAHSPLRYLPAAGMPAGYVPSGYVPSAAPRPVASPSSAG